MKITNRTRSFSKKSSLHFRLFFRKYPALFYTVKWLLISLIAGALCGSASAFFLVSLNWATTFREAHVWIIALLPIAGFAVGLLYHYFGKSVAAGNNLLLDTIHEPKEIIPFRMAPFVYAGTVITHLFGGSAGREGTALQMAGAISDQLSKPLRLSAEDRKVLLTSAIAAGFGSVFGTPLAGAIFALEVGLIGRIRYNALFPAFAAAIFADYVTKLWQVAHTHYQIPALPQVSISTIFYSVISGIVFGLMAAAFSKLMHSITNIFKVIGYAPLRPFAGGIIVAAGVYFLGSTQFIGLGIPTIVDALNHKLPWYDFALKTIFTIITLSAGFKGGEVTPLFFIGATLGNALSYFIPMPTGLLSGMGFVAVFAGATNTPLACSIMAIELFGSDCGVFVAIACIVAYLFSGNNSIYFSQRIGEAKNIRYNAYEGKRFKDL